MANNCGYLGRYEEGETLRCSTPSVKLHVAVLAQMMGFVQHEDFKVLVMH